MWPTTEFRAAAVAGVLALAWLGAGCGDDRPVDSATETVAASVADDPVRPIDRVDVFDVAAQPCDRPTARSGVATLVGPGLLLTAAHVVEGPLRRLEIGGLPGTVVATDERLDLALVGVDGLPEEAAPVPVGWLQGDDALVVTPAGDQPVSILRTVRLTVDDVSSGTVSERRSHVIAGAVDGGVSGAPLLENEHLVGVVVLAVRATDESHAVAGDEVESFVSRVVGPVSDRSGTGSSVVSASPC